MNTHIITLGREEALKFIIQHGMKWNLVSYAYTCCLLSNFDYVTLLPTKLYREIVGNLIDSGGVWDSMEEARAKTSCIINYIIWIIAAVQSLIAQHLPLEEGNPIVCLLFPFLGFIGY